MKVEILNKKEIYEEEIEVSVGEFIEQFLYIVDKESGLPVKFHMRKAQRILFNAIMEEWENGRPARFIVLKARQLGFSTLIEAIIFSLTVLHTYMSAGIITHRDDATNNLFDMFKRFYDNLPEGDFKPITKATNAKEMIFGEKGGGGLNSKIKCMTASPKGVGRSSTIRLVHASEFAFWEGDKKMILASLLQAVPSTAKTLVVIESTANGYEEFKNMWDKAVAGRNDFKPFFFAWFEDDSYKRDYTGFSLTAEEIELKENFGITNEQLAWRRWCIINNCSGDVKLFKQEYPTYPEEAFITSGKCAFDTEAILKRLKYIPEPKKFDIEYDFVYDKTLGNSGEMTVKNPRLTKGNSKSELNVYKEPKPFYPYIVSCDTKGEGSDFAVADVIDNTTGEQVATLTTMNDTDLLMRKVVSLAKLYNNALLIVETNFDPSSIVFLRRMGYKKIYRREVEDRITQELRESYGFKTTTITRPILLGYLKKIVRENTNLINDRTTLIEMLTFVRNPSNNKEEASAGAHDDHVMSLGIAWYGYHSDQQSHEAYHNLQAKKKSNWIEESFSKKKRGKKWW